MTAKLTNKICNLDLPTLVKTTGRLVGSSLGVTFWLEVIIDKVRLVSHSNGIPSGYLRHPTS